MIQRKQTVYLSLTILLSLLFLTGSNLNFTDKSGSVMRVAFGGLLRNSGGEGFELIGRYLPLSVLMTLIPVISLITIMLYKNRKIQMRLALSVIILVAGLTIVLCYYSWSVITEYGADIIPGFKMVLPLLMLVFAVLAYRGIRKDDALVKSYDRLR